MGNSRIIIGSSLSVYQRPLISIFQERWRATVTFVPSVRTILSGATIRSGSTTPVKVRTRKAICGRGLIFGVRLSENLRRYYLRLVSQKSWKCIIIMLDMLCQTYLCWSVSVLITLWLDEQGHVEHTLEWKFCPKATAAPATPPKLKMVQKTATNLPFWPSVGYPIMSEPWAAQRRPEQMPCSAPAMMTNFPRPGWMFKALWEYFVKQRDRLRVEGRTGKN